jgi:transketolase
MYDAMKNTKRNFENIARLIRKDIVSMSFRAHSAHSGGALSVVEILVTLYFDIMHISPKNPNSHLFDRLVFSKGHDAKALYAVLAMRGYFPKRSLETYEFDDGILPGHNVRGCVPGIDVSTGSLGHGLPIATGIALARKMDRNCHRVFCILSDGECDEGTTWETALFASHHHLDNLVVIVDYNKLQGFGFTDDVLSLEPFSKKWEAFGWETRECDGHSFHELLDTLHVLPFKKGKPSIVIAHTVKGRGGIPKYVNTVASQYKSPTNEEYKTFMEDKA